MNAALIILLNLLITTVSTARSENIPSAATHQLSAIVYASSESWSSIELEQQMIVTRQAYAQCGVELSWEIIYTNSLHATIEKEVFPEDPKSILNIANAINPDFSQLRLFFTDRFILQGKPTKKSTGFSRALFDDALKTENLPKSILNTAWFSSEIKLSPEKSHCYGADYSVVVHEMAHILTATEGHNPNTPYNTLSLCMGGHRNNHLTPSQCERIRNSTLVEPL